MLHDNAALALELEQTDDEDDPIDDGPVGLSFFAEVDDADAAFVPRFLFDRMDLTSKTEARICDRVFNIYRRKLVDRGIIKQTTHTDARWDAARADRERTFAQLEREPITEGDDMAERTAPGRQRIIDMHLKLESKHGRSPSAQEIVDALGDGTTIGTVYTSISVARKKGQLGARVKGDDERTKTKAPPAPKTRRRARSMTVPTEDPPASSLERDASNDELVAMLRAKLERIDRTREKVAGLLELLESA